MKSQKGHTQNKQSNGNPQTYKYRNNATDVYSAYIEIHFNFNENGERRNTYRRKLD